MSMRRGSDSSYPIENVEVTADAERAELRTAINRPSTRIMTYEPLLNDAEAARFLGGLHPKTVQRMARRGELPHYRVGKYYRYRASELDAWIQVHSRGQINPP